MGYFSFFTKQVPRSEAALQQYAAANNLEFNAKGKGAAGAGVHIYSFAKGTMNRLPMELQIGGAIAAAPDSLNWDFTALRVYVPSTFPLAFVRQKVGPKKRLFANMSTIADIDYNWGKLRDIGTVELHGKKEQMGTINQIFTDPVVAAIGSQLQDIVLGTNGTTISFYLYDIQTNPAEFARLQSIAQAVLPMLVPAKQ